MIHPDFFKIAKAKSAENIKDLLLKMGVLLVDYGHVWSKEMKAAFNKAIRELEKQQQNI